MNTCFCPLKRASWPKLWNGSQPFPSRSLSRHWRVRESCTCLFAQRGAAGSPRSPAIWPSRWPQIPTKRLCSSISLSPLETQPWPWELPQNTRPRMQSGMPSVWMRAFLAKELLVRHQSGVFVLAAPSNVMGVEGCGDAIDKLIAVARREFDHVIVDVGSRMDLVDTDLFKRASTVYLVTLTGVSDLRNSNRLISQFFPPGGPNLEVVINRFESRLLGAVNEDVVAKAVGRPVRWKIPEDRETAREMQYGVTGVGETRVSRLSLEMAGAITGRPAPSEKKKGFSLKRLGKGVAEEASGNNDPLSIRIVPPATERATEAVTRSTPDAAPATRASARVAEVIARATPAAAPPTPASTPDTPTIAPAIRTIAPSRSLRRKSRPLSRKFQLLRRQFEPLHRPRSLRRKSRPLSRQFQPLRQQFRPLPWLPRLLIGRPPPRLPTATRSHQHNSTPRHRWREHLSTHPVRVPCCPPERTSSPCPSRRQTASSTPRHKPLCRSTWRDRRRSYRGRTPIRCPTARHSAAASSGPQRQCREVSTILPRRASCWSREGTHSRSDSSPQTLKTTPKFKPPYRSSWPRRPRPSHGRRPSRSSLARSSAPGSSAPRRRSVAHWTTSRRRVQCSRWECTR